MNENDLPLVSVLMGVYYRKDRLLPLEQSVRSILAQSERDFELLICDDGSSGPAMELLDRLALSDMRIRLLRPGGKLTLPQKLNHCLSEARGQYLARMDDDDFSHPGRFEAQISFLREHPEISFVGCNANLRRGGAVVGQRMLPERPTVRDFYFVQPYIHPTVIFRREAVEQVGGYSESKYAILCEDYDLFLRLYAAGFRGANLQEILFDYTIPMTSKGSRKMSHRWNETVTRYYRFRDLKVLPEAWPYVIKPLAVGLLPEPLLTAMKRKRSDKEMQP